MMKALITGGAGFIGSHIVDLLIKEEYDVVVIDDLSKGDINNLNPKAKFYKENILSDNLRAIFEKERFDYVIHNAAQVNVRDSTKYPAIDARINIMGSLNIMECCKRFNVKKVIYASSGGTVYGEPKYLPIDEKHGLKPISPYGISKQVIESYLRFYWRNYGLDFISLRYSNVYGPRQNPRGEAGVISIFIDNIMNNKVCIINGDGNQTRDFVFVEDVAKANLLALNKNTRNKSINIATNTEISVNDIYKQLINIFNINNEPRYSPEIKGELRKISLDISLARKELNWEPKSKLSKGLLKTVEWFKNRKVSL